MKKRSGDATVYSSEHGRMCPHCGLPTARCVCRANPRGAAAAAPIGDGRVRVGRSTKGRKGKGVTTIEGLPLDAEALKDLAAELKRRCGTGGGVKDGVIEIQGEHRDTLIEALREKGYDPKRSGG